MTRGFADTIARCVGRQVVRIDLEDADGSLHELRVTFSDGSQLVLTDAGQDCCESRYMVCDDDLGQTEPAALVSIDVRDMSPSSCDGVGCDGEEAHEQAALIIQTTRGALTVVTHNEHNGYYGGFSLTARLS